MLGMPPGGSAQEAVDAGLRQQLLAAEALNMQLEEALKQAREQLGEQLVRDKAAGVVRSSLGAERSGSDGTQDNAQTLRSGAEVAARSKAAGGMMEGFEEDRLRCLVAERDREIAELRAELVLVEAARDEPGHEARVLAAQLAQVGAYGKQRAGWAVFPVLRSATLQGCKRVQAHGWGSWCAFTHLSI